MNQRDALRELIKTSRLDPQLIQDMLARVDAMSDEDVAALGTSLAAQRQSDVRKAQQAVVAIDTALSHNP